MRLFRGDGPRPLSLSERLYRRFFLKYHSRYLITGLQARAREQSLDYIEAYMSDALIFRDRWDLLLAFKHPGETHLIVLTVEQPRSALEQRVSRLLREQKVMPRCPYCQLRADERSGIAHYLSSEHP